MTMQSFTNFVCRLAVFFIPVVGAPLLTACSGGEPDAYGNFEAREVVVSAEAGGQLVSFPVTEGNRLAAGAVIGQIDTVVLALQREELIAQSEATRSRATEAAAQIDVLQAQLATASAELRRTRRLYEAEAATAQQLNLAEGEVRVLQQRIKSARAHRNVAQRELSGGEARTRQIEQQIVKSRVVSPISGVVLTTYAEAGEFVQPGQPLYKIARLDTLTLRAYVTGAQLSEIQIGKTVRVQIDADGDRLRVLPGRVTWIASEAEFTPTPIQTREDRTDQVYAVKIHVPNPDGMIKIGMPGEVVFGAEEDAHGAEAVIPPAPSPHRRS